MHLPKNSRMGQSDATFRHHLDEIAGAELKRQIPPDAQDDDFLVKVPPFEEILCRGRFRHPSRYRQTPRVSTVCTRTLYPTCPVALSRYMEPGGIEAGAVCRERQSLAIEPAVELRTPPWSPSQGKRSFAAQRTDC